MTRRLRRRRQVIQSRAAIEKKRLQALCCHSTAVSTIDRHVRCSVDTCQCCHVGMSARSNKLLPYDSPRTDGRCSIRSDLVLALLRSRNDCKQRDQADGSPQSPTAAMNICLSNLFIICRSRVFDGIELVRQDDLCWLEKKKKTTTKILHCYEERL